MQTNRIFIDKKKNEKIEQTINDISKSVFIGNCEGTTIIIKGKFNSLSVDNSKNVVIEVDTLIGSFNINKSEGVRVNVKETVKHFQLDNSSNLALKVKDPKELVVSHTSCAEVNVLVPKSDDLKEHPLPTTFTSTFENDKFVHSIHEGV